MSEPLPETQGWRPVPDPTVLTTEQLHREIGALQLRMESLIEALHDHTTTLFAGLREIIEEKLRSVDRQLALVESQRVEQKSDTKAAVDAALTAQKEAVKEQTTASERAIAKSEAATTKQLEQLNQTFATAIKGVTDLLNDTKDRVSRIEAAKVGGKETVGSLYAFGGLLVAFLGVAIIAATFIATH